MSCRSHPLLTPGGGCGARKYVNNDTGLLTVTRGRDRKDGKSITVTGQTIDPNGNTVVTFSDGNSITVPKGKDGISVTVKGTSQDPNGNTVIEFSDGSKVTVQRGKDGRDGKDGKSITVTGQTIDPNGNTVVTFNGALCASTNYR